MAKTMPNAEYLNWTDHKDVLNRLKKVFEVFPHDSQPRNAVRNSEAQNLWGRLYRELNGRKRAPNCQDSLARDTSHIVKLSLIYAILDKTTLITADHMLAAYEVTEYCERSVKWIFWHQHREPHS